MAKAKHKPTRGRKLKVYRTAAGFHDAYVAAPSQKAALEAWGTDTNLFARGEAEEVTEPELTKEPLSRPGEVVRVLRGTKKEQAEALGKAGAKRMQKRAQSPPAKAKGRKPSREAVDKAEKAIVALEEMHEAELRAIAEEEQRIAERRRKAQQAHGKRKAELEEKRDAAKARYEREVKEWEG